MTKKNRKPHEEWKALRVLIEDKSSSTENEEKLQNANAGACKNMSLDLDGPVWHIELSDPGPCLRTIQNSSLRSNTKGMFSRRLKRKQETSKLSSP